LGEITKWLLPLLVLVVAFTVFALSIFGQSWTKLFESAEYLHASVIMLALLVPVCLIILWNSQSFVSFSWRIFEASSEADGIRGEFLLKTLIPLFASMMILQGLAIALRAAMCLSGQMRPARPPHTPKFFSEQELEH